MRPNKSSRPVDGAAILIRNIINRERRATTLLPGTTGQRLHDHFSATYATLLHAGTLHVQLKPAFFSDDCATSHWSPMGA
jgi:hypothetical protein